MRHISLIVLISFIFSSISHACNSSYTPPGNIASSASVIFKLKVLKVYHFKKNNEKAGMGWGPRGGNYAVFKRELVESEDKNGFAADVEVIECIKGKSKLNKFLLFSGPYESCSPGESYHFIEKGDEMYLSMIYPPTPDTKKISQIRRGAISFQVPKILQGLTEAHKTHVKLLKSAYPKEYAEATKIAANAPDFIKNAIPKQNYAVLHALRLLSFHPAKDSCFALDSGNELPVAPGSAPRLCATSEKPLPNKSKPLAKLFSSAFKELQKRKPLEVRTFHDKITAGYMRDYLFLPDKYIKNLTVTLDKKRNMTFAEAAIAQPYTPANIQKEKPDLSKAEPFVVNPSKPKFELKLETEESAELKEMRMAMEKMRQEMSDRKKLGMSLEDENGEPQDTYSSPDNLSNNLPVYDTSNNADANKRKYSDMVRDEESLRYLYALACPYVKHPFPVFSRPGNVRLNGEMFIGYAKRNPEKCKKSMNIIYAASHPDLIPLVKQSIARPEDMFTGYYALMFFARLNDVKEMNIVLDIFKLRSKSIFESDENSEKLEELYSLKWYYDRMGEGYKSSDFPEIHKRITDEIKKIEVMKKVLEEKLK